MKKNSAFFAILASGLLFASCAGEEIPGYSDSDLNDTPPVVEEPVPDNPITENIPIEFEIPVSTLTKTTLDLEDGMTVNWQDGDKVGLFYRYTSNDEATTATKACNVPYEYDAETGKFVAVDTPAYWDEGVGAEKHAMYVYYPYNENSTDITAIAGSLPEEWDYDATATQNEVASYGCFAGRVTDIEYGKPVTFGSLYHQLAMMRLEIRNTTGSDIVINEVQVESTRSLAGNFVFKMSSVTKDLKIWPITTYPNVKTITINVAHGEVAAGEAVDVRFLMRAGDCSGQTFNVTVTTVEGKTYTVDFQGAGTLIGGQRVAKPFNLTSPHKVKDVVDGGVLFKINGDNTGGLVLFPARVRQLGVQDPPLTMGLIDTEKIDLSTLPEASTDDGAVNVAILKEVDPTLENCPAVKACEELGSRIDGNWYLPAVEEWRTLLGVYNGTEWKATNKHQTSAGEVNIPDEENQARLALDAILKSLTTAIDQDENNEYDSGAAINLSYKTNGTEYWSSTWTSATNGYALRTGAFKTVTDPLMTAKSVRCIKKVNFADLQNSTEENPTEENPTEE